MHWLGHDKTLREQGVDDACTVLLRYVIAFDGLRFVLFPGYLQLKAFLMVVISFNLRKLFSPLWTGGCLMFILLH